MSDLHQSLRAITAELETERDPDRLCFVLADSLARLEQEVVACRELPADATPCYDRARAALAALRRYRRVVALFDGVPDEAEIDAVAGEFLALAEQLADLPVRRSVTLEFTRLVQLARGPAADMLPATAAAG